LTEQRHAEIRSAYERCITPLGGLLIALEAGDLDIKERWRIEDVQRVLGQARRICEQDNPPGDSQ
jgi:hypothetical protein